MICGIFIYILLKFNIYLNIQSDDSRLLKHITAVSFLTYFDQNCAKNVAYVWVYHKDLRVMLAFLPGYFINFFNFFNSRWKVGAL